MNTTLMDATLNKYPIYLFFHFIGIFFYVHLCNFNVLCMWLLRRKVYIFFQMLNHNFFEYSNVLGKCASFIIEKVIFLRKICYFQETFS